MWILIKLIAGWLIGLAWKLLLKKPIDWGSKAKALLPILSRLITWRQRKADAVTPDPDSGPEDIDSEDIDKRPGWRLRRLFKRLY